MRVKLLLILLSFFALNFNIYGENYLRINPKVKFGKYENGNHFLDFVPAKFNYRLSDQFSVAGGASVGFTSPRNGAAKLNHYSNRLTVRATYRPSGGLGYFAEANFSNIIDGADNSVPYFRTGNYQAIGIEIDWLEIN